MSHRVVFVRTYIMGAALFGSIFAYGAANAQQGCCEGGSAIGANVWTKGNATSEEWPAGASPLVGPQWQWPVPAEGYAGLKDDGPEPYWWTHGEIETGGRDFVNNPRVSGATAGNDPVTGQYYGNLNQKSLAKFYEYGIQAPGAFGGGHVAIGSSDGLYQLDLWANNVASNFDGFSDQSYMLTASKAGEHYVTVTWDQTPHIYSTEALTPFTITAGEPAALKAAGINVGANARYLAYSGPQIPTSAAGFPQILNYLHPMDLGIQRDTLGFAYRWTPDETWDLNVDYTHRDRYGTQPGGIAALGAVGNTLTQPTQIPVPVDDTTQNFGVSGERMGETPWGKYTFKLGYSGSIYTDNIGSYFVQNPFFPTQGSCGATTGNCVAAQMSTWPSNAANGVSATMTADLPFNTRYAGTLSYTDMTQDQTFLPMTNNPNATVAPTAYQIVSPGINWNAVNFGFVNGDVNRPISSLNGDIQTVLSNNVLTTRITPDLTAKWTYRFYDFDNGTPNIAFPCMLHEDATGTGVANCPNGNPSAIQSLTMAYIKQDAGADLNWRPNRNWNFNAAYNFERYDWSQVPVDATNESSAKLSADWKPLRWLDTRLSGSFASRRNEGYDYTNNVGAIQFPAGFANLPGAGKWCATSVYGNPASYLTCSTPFINPAYREYMWSDRDETKVSFLANFAVAPGVTISPSVKYQDDSYGVDPTQTLGLKDNSILSAGVDAVYTPHPDLSFTLSYYWEKYNTLFYSQNASGVTATPPYFNPAALVTNRDNEYVNTLAAAMNYAVIPNKLNFDLRASVSDGLVQQSQACQPVANNANTCGAFPNDTNLFEHVEASLTYKLDPNLLGDAGYKDMKLRLRYMWERNAVANWQNDPLAPFTSSVNPTSATGATSTSALWMSYNNPNYDVQAVAASLIVQW